MAEQDQLDLPGMGLPELPQELRDLVNPSIERIEQLILHGPQNYFDELVLTLVFYRAKLLTKEQTDRFLKEMAQRFVKAYYKRHPPPGPTLRYAAP